ncbi:hypothetical protein PYCCODRAFT_152912 [Trametes coccinea BRFM310]|uniref:Uncharacterized protein n=1 Tax=Trametes coccinea (strain BRFM310) TaxID=1353009 RepID=A0A1Y2ITD6_TRAC3|nr:hypothetical protein PYCCODRAFT_152912 [Trametes coccinea BRFM310]
MSSTGTTSLPSSHFSYPPRPHHARRRICPSGRLDDLLDYKPYSRSTGAPRRIGIPPSSVILVPLVSGYLGELRGWAVQSPSFTLSFTLLSRQGAQGALKVHVPSASTGPGRTAARSMDRPHALRRGSREAD